MNTLDKLRAGGVVGGDVDKAGLPGSTCTPGVPGGDNGSLAGGNGDAEVAAGVAAKSRVIRVVATMSSSNPLTSSQPESHSV